MTRPAKVFRYFLACLTASIISSIALAENNSCTEAGETHIWISPLNPEVDERAKIMAVATDSPLSELELIDSEDRHRSLPFSRTGGPPWSLIASVDKMKKGGYRVVAKRNGEITACHRLDVNDSPGHIGVQSWGLAAEAFYSAWVEALFSAPLEENSSFSSLEPVLSNPERNFLHNHLGLNEDNSLPLTPDCADLPYTLRAYFAWKVGLPIAFRGCDRGSSKAPPRCEAARIKTEFTDGVSSQSTFKRINRLLVDSVHSGSARTRLEDENSDLYPVGLSRETLWPGRVYADPYGHVLVLVGWVPQTKDRSGLLLAVDAQPDNSVARKRFWEGTFLFSDKYRAGAGFKAFRPLVRKASGGWRTLSNKELIDTPYFAPFSLEQAGLSSEDFYAKLAGLINPDGLAPKQVYEATLDALVEQIETRVISVANGEAYKRRHPGSVVPMPSGAAIFQTIGPWEDYSTPSRDLRLLIAINVLDALPGKIVSHPELFNLKGRTPEAAMAEIENYHAKRIRERSIQYIRSDGSRWRLSVADVLARRSAYEMAYNPNDCVELRWGAQPGTPEYSTCARLAPAQQRAKMERYRIWFRELRRPTR